MSHKIDGYAAPATLAVTAGRVTAPARGASEGTRAPGSVLPVDSVALTADAQSLHQLERSISAMPVVDQDRVEKIRMQLQDGTYRINPDVIAHQLSRMEWELAP